MATSLNNRIREVHALGTTYGLHQSEQKEEGLHC